jgi:hypothetical protein
MIVATDGRKFMTGERWYARYEKELDEFPFNLGGEISYSDVLKVAKKASGI